MNLLNPISRLKIFLILAAVVIVSCDDNDNDPKGKYEHGAFIVDEGNFTQANGTITYYNTTSGESEQNIYRTVTGFAGSVAQSLSIHDDRGYLVLNGDNKIEILDTNTFESLGTLTGTDFDKPRYVEIVDNKAYISMWGPYEEGGYSLIDSYVLVVDLATKSTVKKIETDEGTENLLVADDYLFASNYNFGGSHTVSVIKTEDNSLVDQIEVGSGPSGLVKDENDKVWVICTGDYGALNGQLVRINPETLVVEKTIDLNLNPDADLAISSDKKSILYSSGTDVYSIAINAESAPSDPLFTADAVVTNYALGVDPDSGDIWMGDALDYTSAGKVYIYTSSGSLKTSFGTGIAPGQFVFK